MISKTLTALSLLTFCCVTPCSSQKASEPVPEKALKVSLNHATDAVRHFIYLRPKGERGNLMKMKRNKDVFDEVDERSGTSTGGPCGGNETNHSGAIRAIADPFYLIATDSCLSSWTFPAYSNGPM